MEKFKPFYVGQAVKCINDSGHFPTPFKPEIGKEYTVTSITRGCCDWHITIGIAANPMGQRCYICHKNAPSNNNEYSYRASRFRAITEDFQAITFARIQQEEPVSMN